MKKVDYHQHANCYPYCIIFLLSNPEKKSARKLPCNLNCLSNSDLVCWVNRLLRGLYCSVNCICTLQADRVRREKNQELPSVTSFQTGDGGEQTMWPFSIPPTKTKYKTMYMVQPMRSETETKTSNATLPQHEPTAHAGKMMFLLWMLDGHRL